MLLQLSLQQSLDVLPFFERQPLPIDKHVGEERTFPRGPGRARLGELSRVDHVGLQRQHTKQQIDIGIHPGQLTAV
jgi:tetraacyldisaccharide-1-P 4'-kinase